MSGTEQALGKIELLTESVLRTLSEIDTLAQDFSHQERGADSHGLSDQQMLDRKLSLLVSQYEELREQPAAGVCAPAAVLQHIDRGENPDLYWQQVVEATVSVTTHACIRTQAHFAPPPFVRANAF